MLWLFDFVYMEVRMEYIMEVMCLKEGKTH